MTEMKPVCICLMLLCYLQLPAALAKHITGQLPNGIWVNAEYRAANEGKPTILLIHPLNQTNQFSTIINLADSLADNGYGVLTPNLSLGISDRRLSMACEAIHIQSLMQDIEEASFWVNWLSDNINSPVIGMGHSTGALQILGYPGSKEFSSIVLISLVTIGPEGAAAINPEQKEHARQGKANGLPDTLGHYRFSYCMDYVTSRDAYLDTASWDYNKVSQHLSDLELKTSIILGTEDYAISQPWLSEVNHPHIQVHHIEGADHFFSGSDEFDLHDKVLEILDSEQ